MRPCITREEPSGDRSRPAVESFFTGYLTAQRGASPHTIASYRDTFRLLFTWIRQQAGTRPSDLDFADVGAATVSGFLAMLEDERHNTSRTRSQRLAAIHSLFRHAAPGHPEHAALIARVLAIQPRKPARETVAWLTEDEADALLAAPDTGTWTGRRDRVLMLLMLTSGPRVSHWARTAGEPPSSGRSILAIIGWIKKSRAEPTKSVQAKKAGKGTPPSYFPSLRGRYLSVRSQRGKGSLRPARP